LSAIGARDYNRLGETICGGEIAKWWKPDGTQDGRSRCESPDGGRGSPWLQSGEQRLKPLRNGSLVTNRAPWRLPLGA